MTKASKQNHQYFSQNNSKTPFETYLNYTNEKENSIKTLSQILKKSIKMNSSLLDIGCGDGSYLLSALKNNKNKTKIDFLEPSKKLYDKLIKNIEGSQNCKSYNYDFETFINNNYKKYDHILASHLYHFPIEQYESFINQILSILKSKGTFIWIERGMDDITEFKREYKTLLLPEKYPKNWIPRDYNRALEILKLQKGVTKLEFSESTLSFPLSNFSETIKIIEFYLNIDWSTITADNQKEILNYIKRKKGIFKQQEGIIIYKS